MIQLFQGMMVIPEDAPQNPSKDRVDRIQVDFKASDPNRKKVSVWRGSWKTSMIVFSLMGEPTDNNFLIESQGDWRKADNTPIAARSKLYIRKDGILTYLKLEVYDSVQAHTMIFDIPETIVSLTLDVE